MIGQEELKRQFENCKSYQDLPRCMMFVGAVGSGRKTFIQWLALKVGIRPIEIEGKVDDIREMIDYCYKAEYPILYMISDVEKISASGQNAMLKVLEEPPKNAIFALTTCQEDLVLSTIHSRCTIYRMGQYSMEELVGYLKSEYPKCSQPAEVLKICINIGDIQSLLTHNIEDFSSYVNLVVDNIGKVSGANSFKIGSKLNLGDDDKKFDLVLFWRAFVNKCIEKIEEDREKYTQGVIVTMKYMTDLRIKGINKQMAFDNWVLDIREKWL